jgi:hypothetical protein
MLNRKLVFAAALIFFVASSLGLHAQARKWVIPPNVIDFSTSPPTASSLPGSPSEDPYHVANGAFDSRGHLLFYVIQGESPGLDVFDGNGNKIDDLAGAANSLQIAVVPVPQSCDLQYYIVYFADAIGSQSPKTPLVLTYSVFDATAGKIVMKDVQVGPGYVGVTFALSFGSLAVTPLRSDATRLLYAVNNNFVDKFLIDASGISWADTLLEADAGFLPIQAVLSSDDGELAFGAAGGIEIATLDSQGDFSDNVVLPVAAPTGLAFSRDGSWFFFGDGSGLNYVSLADPTLSAISLPGSDGYGSSQLQLAVDDRIYASSGGDLGAIDATGPIPFFTAEVVPEIFANNLSGVLPLPAQLGGASTCGNPALIQSTFGVKGNFEVVVPDSCGLAHYWRDNDNGNTWNGPDLFGADAGAVDAVSMIQMSFGNLEVVARVGDRLALFARDNTGTWSAPAFFATGASGTPSLIEGTYGVFHFPADLEVATPLASGGIALYSYSLYFGAWSGPFLIPSSLNLPAAVTDVSLIQSTLGLAGDDLQLVARVGDRLAHFSRDSTGIWSAPDFFATGVSGTPSLIQGNFFTSGGLGNFELVVPVAAGGMAHYWRDDAAQWHGPGPFADGSVRSASLIQSNYGQNLEVVARRNCSLVHYFRTDFSSPSPVTWFGPTATLP